MEQKETTAAPAGTSVRMVRFTVDLESIFREAFPAILVATTDEGVQRRVVQHAAAVAAPLFHDVRIHDCVACGFNMRVKNLDEFVTQYRFMVSKIDELADTEGRYPNIYEFEAKFTLTCDCRGGVSYTYDLGSEGLYLLSYEYVADRFAKKATTITVENVTLI